MASYAEAVRFVGIIERGLARFEAIRIEAKKQKNSKFETKATNKLSDWRNVKALHLKGLNVSAGHDFEVRVISISNKGMMVAIKHPSQKHPVTRHLQKKGNFYTGKAPFGAGHFVEYHVNIVGDLQSKDPNITPAMIKLETPQLKKAA